jgi:nucleoside-diphosphate-sugar epimerase
VEVLVTGATGFLGSAVARRLVDRGARVRVLVRPSADRRRLAGLPVAEVAGDVTDAGSVRRAVAGVDAVIHCAARVGVGTTEVADMERVNVDGTRHVLDAAVEAGAIAVHVSSVAVHGATGTRPEDESWWNPEPPVVAYEATKRAAHDHARALAEAGAPVRIGTPGGIYGPGDESTLGQVVHAFMRRPMPVAYLPDRVQSLVNVDDAADALVRILESGRDGEEYLVCADAVTFRTWFDLIAAAAGRRPPVAYLPTDWVRRSAGPAAALLRRLGRDPRPVLDVIAVATRHQSYSGAKARRELGWAPRSLATGMAEVAAALGRGPRRPSR